MCNTLADFDFRWKMKTGGGEMGAEMNWSYGMFG